MSPVVDVRAVPMPLLAPHVIDVDSDALVYTEKGRLRVVRGLTRGALTTADVELPSRCQIHALALRDGVVYAGGVAGTELLGRVDLRGEMRWRSLPVPGELRWIRKAIHGIVTYDRWLFAVDNTFFPGYVLVYDVTDPRLPRLIRSRLFAYERPCERVLSVTACDRTMVLLTTSERHGRRKAHITLFDLVTLEERRVFSAEDIRGASPAGARGVDFSSMAFLGDALLIAAGNDGVGVVSIDRLLASEAGSLPLESVRFVPVPAGRVTRVIPVDAAQVLAVVESRAGWFQSPRLDSVLVPIA